MQLPALSDHWFRENLTTDSEGKRPLVPVLSNQKCPMDGLLMVGLIGILNRHWLGWDGIGQLSYSPFGQCLKRGGLSKSSVKSPI